jgi:parallel beta-helix repeat protein
MTHWRTPFIAAATGVFLLLNCTGASAIAPTLLSNCTTIVTPGFYELETPIVTSGVISCIDIFSAGVTLSLQSTITGDGTHGIGIHIEVGAAGTIIRGNAVKENPTAGAKVSGFNVGVRDDQGGSVIGDFQISNNHTSGLVMQGASADICDDLRVDNNGHDGIHVISSSRTRITFSEANSNGVYGLWLDNSDHSVIDRLTASGNGTTNIEVGIPLSDLPSPANIFDGVSIGGARFGVLIERASTGNTVTQSQIDANSTPDTTVDAEDNNHNCKKNLWFNNTFISSSLPCIR